MATLWGCVAVGVDRRWILATSAVPALATLTLRQGLPESPRWLVSQGRDDEARDIVKEHLSESYYDDEDLGDESTDKAMFKELFSPKLRTRTAFACIFYTCLVAPYFAMFTFALPVFKALGVTDPRGSVIGSNVVAVIGAIVGTLVSSVSGVAHCC